MGMNFSLYLRKQRRSRVLKQHLLRMLSGSKRRDIIGKQLILHEEKLRKL